MTTTAVVTYAYGQIDQARTELEHSSCASTFNTRAGHEGYCGQ